MRKPKIGDLVLTGSHLTSIQRVGKLHRAEGAWHFMRSDMGGWGPYLHFAQDWTITYAELDVTVCRIPWGAGHPCGLTHLPADELAWLTGEPVAPPAASTVTVTTILDGDGS
jgi:hypothetical protein